MVSLGGLSNEFQYKCMNCNSYFTYDDFTSKTSTIKNDMVKVVRCKNCKHGEPGACGDEIDCDGVWHDDDWFCADGERK